MKNENGDVECIVCGEWYDPTTNTKEVKESSEYICPTCWDEPE